MRLQTFLARAGAAPSRRKAEALISAGRVRVNGATAYIGANVSPEARVLLDDREVTLPEKLTYLALNKPAGYLTTMRDEPELDRPTVADLIPALPGIVPVGRLDAATTGLLIVTNDGQLAHRIAHPSAGIEKEYRLTVRNPASRKALAALSTGPVLDDGPMCPAVLGNVRRSSSETTFNLTIHEGRNRIIRRACETVGLQLTGLKRLRIGPVTLGDLPEGSYRSLTPLELQALR